MDKHETKAVYDHLYEVTYAEALGWSPVRLWIALPTMLLRGERSEAAWGAVDAITDLLRRPAGHRPRM